jgi:UDP-glucose 4-epimerase
VALMERGDDVLILDNFTNSKPSVIERIERITGKECACVNADLLDAAAVGAIFEQYPVESVIHFAGFKAVGESVAKPGAYYENNLIGSLHLFDAMAKYGVKKIIFSSSATVYRSDNPTPYYEDFPLGAVNPYGWTKVMIEQILRDLCAADPEWSAALLRYFNPIGAHPSGLIGEDPQGIPNNLLPYVARVAAGQLPTIHIYGDDYETSDGTGVRDYIHVMDLAEGHLLAMDYIKNRTGTYPFNLGTGKGSSVKEVVAAFERACGQNLPQQIDARRPGDLAVVYANADLAEKELGFRTRYDLGRMCEDAWHWQQTGAKEA